MARSIRRRSHTAAPVTPRTVPGVAPGAGPNSGLPPATFPGMPQTTPAWSGPRIIPGVASLALHRLLREPFQPGRVIAVLPSVIYLDFGQHAGEPQVIALTASDALCLPNAIALKVPHQDAATGTDGTDGETSTTQAKATEEAATEEAWAGHGRVLACGMDVQVRRWWDPCPVFGPLSRVRLEHGMTALARVYSAADGGPGWKGTTGRPPWPRPARPVTSPGRSKWPKTWWASGPGWHRAGTA